MLSTYGFEQTLPADHGPDAHGAELGKLHGRISLGNAIRWALPNVGGGGQGRRALGGAGDRTGVRPVFRLTNIAESCCSFSRVPLGELSGCARLASQYCPAFRLLL